MPERRSCNEKFCDTHTASAATVVTANTDMKLLGCSQHPTWRIALLVGRDGGLEGKYTALSTSSMLATNMHRANHSCQRYEGILNDRKVVGRLPALLL